MSKEMLELAGEIERNVSIQADGETISAPLFRREQWDLISAALRASAVAASDALASLPAPAAAPTREEIAREPGETAPKDGRRIILFWEFPGLPMHFELGWWKDGSWRNTYGLPFSGEPHHWFDPAIIALKSAPAK